MLHEKDCQFIMISTLNTHLISTPTPTNELNAAFSYDTMAFLSGSGMVKFWKFRTDEWIFCKVESTGFAQILLHKEKFLLIRADFLFVFDIPGHDHYTSRLDAFQLEPQVVLHPRYQRPFPPRQGLFAYFLCLRTWYHDHSVLAATTSLTFSRLDFCKIPQAILSQDMAARTDLPQLETWATLSRQKSTSLPIHAGWVPCKAGFYRITHIDAERFICEGVIDHTDGTVKTIAMPIDLQMSLRASQTTATANFCPASGRICFAYRSS
ncbi:hypothetical protein BJ165DRAFT_170195 [Panaeolus papilionaceus]|nr:hypothetical protein BJ165DRAFT_170195 [Panaeolus papilionaceus]